MGNRGIRWLLGSLAAILSIGAAAQSFPSRPIRVIVPYGPGGSSDIITRVLAARMSERFGQLIVVENRPEAGGTIGLEAAASSSPDGYTLLLTLARAPEHILMMPRPRYSLLIDFELVAPVASVPNVLVANSSAPYKSVKDLIFHAKSNPGKLKFGSTSAGSLPYMLAEEFRAGAGVNIVNVPYRSPAQATEALIGQHVDLQFAPLPTVTSHLKSEKLRLLAVADTRRSAQLPNVPTMGEAGGPAIDGSSKYALFAPRGTPAAVVNRLRQEVNAALNNAEVKQRLVNASAEPNFVLTDIFLAEMKSDRTRWSKLAGDKSGSGSFSSTAPPPLAGAPAPKAKPKPMAKPPAAANGEKPDPTKSSYVLADRAPVWNILAEEQGAPYRIKDVLRAETDYTVRIDLAALAYAPGQTSVATVQAGKAIRDVLKELAARTDKKTAKFTAIVIVDETVFERPEKQEFEFVLDLERLRTFLDGKLAAPTAPLAELQKNGDANFRFAPIEFDLRTESETKLPADPGSIAVSIWHDRIPVDELSFGFCTVKSNCKGVKLEPGGLGGIDSARTALEGKSALPVAAIHLLQFKRGVVGVFRDHTDNKAGYVTWYQNTLPADLSRKFDDITAKLANASPTTLEAGGIGLFNVIFPRGNDAAVKAGDGFAAFVNREIAKKATRTGANTPSLFVRAQFSDKTPPAMLPIAMAAVPVGATAFEFVGRHFRVETPLRLQAYGGASQCISNWYVVGPPEDDGDNAFKAARGALEKNSRMGLVSSKPVLKVGGKPFQITGTIKEFLQWGTTGAMDRPTVLSILSHHDRDHIRFGKDEFPAGALGRSFVGQPTMAILNGCTTGSSGAGATGFIGALNTLGVQAAVATITEVTGDMAADFLDCFALEVESAPANGKLLSEAFSGALICLADTKQHGTKANWYALLGDGGLRLCKP